MIFQCAIIAQNFVSVRSVHLDKVWVGVEDDRKWTLTRVSTFSPEKQKRLWSVCECRTNLTTQLATVSDAETECFYISPSSFFASLMSILAW
jgi:hypothetical protein